MVRNGTSDKEEIVELPTIILLRHGQTVWNVEGRYQGQLDSPLTQKGKNQAKENALKIKRIIEPLDTFMFVSSPLGRAKETTQIMVKELNIDREKIEFLDAIKEFNYGKFEGQTKAFCQEVYKEEFELREANKWSYIIDGGESYEMVTQRLNVWLKSLNKDKVVVMVAHEMINRALRGIYCGLEKKKMLQLRQNNDVVIILENASERLLG